jgi:hypothetical protein
MKHPHNHTPQNSSSTDSKEPGGIASKSFPLTNPWWIYQANQLKIRNNRAAELLAQIESLPDESPIGSEDAR